MWKFIKIYIGVPLAVIALVAQAINLPKNWGTIMNYLPSWAADDWVKLVLGLFSLGYLVWISWPWVKEKLSPPDLVYEGVGINEANPTVTSVITDTITAYIVMIEHLSITSNLDEASHYETTCTIKMSDGSEKTISGQAPEALKKMGIDYKEILHNLHNYTYYCSPLRFEPKNMKAGRFIYWFTDHKDVSYDFDNAGVILNFKKAGSKKTYKFPLQKKIKV